MKANKFDSIPVPDLLRQQAVTISKSGSEVRIDCDNGADATVIFEWLVALSTKSNEI